MNPHANRLFNGVCVDECELAKAAANVYNTDGTLKQEAYADNIPIRADFGDDWELARINNLNLGDDFKFSNDISGFDSALYCKDLGDHREYLYVTRGTDFTSGADWANNIVNGVPQVLVTGSQYEQSVSNAIAIHNAIGANDVLFFAGHSLGGSLASANSLATGDVAFTYNSAGIGVSTLTNINGIDGRSLGENLRDNENLINATVNSEEILNHYFSKIGLGAVGDKTILDGTDADRVRSHEKLAEEQFNKAKESAGNLQLQEAYGFLKNGLSTKKKEINFRLNLHAMKEVLKLLDCDK